ncbi:hypothetical protein WKI68_12850 [Streptomyces sp. MS1.HAVA.3]|uniref:Uncharacterized protein n=1 Tax=Streptomyces caledonius TaxID=3134107 RepID=A0ABU8U2L1_9ACTN
MISRLLWAARRGPQPSPTAMANYLKRGFTVFKTETEQKEEAPTPGPCPGA